MQEPRSGLDAATANKRIFGLDVPLSVARGDQAASLLHELHQLAELSRSRAEESPSDRPEWLLCLAASMALRGMYEESATLGERLEWLEESRDLAAESCDTGTAPDRFVRALWVWDKSGRFLYANNRTRTASRLLTEAVQAFGGQGNWMLPYALQTLAASLRLVGDFQRALDTLQEIEDAVEDPGILQSVERERAQIHFQLGLYDLAAGHLRRRRELLELLPHDADYPPDRSSAAMQEVNLLLALEDFLEAAAASDRYLADEQLFGPGTPFRGSMLFLRDWARAMHEDREGLKDDSGLRALRERIAAEDVPSQDHMTNKLQLAWLELRRGEIERADALIEDASRQIESLRARSGPEGEERPPIPEAALAWALRAHRAMQRGVGEERLEASFSEGEAALAGLRTLHQGVRPRPGGIGFLGPRHRRLVLGTFVRLALRLHGIEDGVGVALEALGEAQALGSLERELGARPPTAAEIRASLVPGDGGLLQFLPAPEGSVALLVDAKGPAACLLPEDRDLEGLALEHLVLLERGARGAGVAAAQETKKVAQKLRDELLPVELRERMAGWRSVVVVGLELFGEVAFEALPWGEGSTLGIELAVERAPSLPLGVHLRREAAKLGPRPEPRLLALLAPTPSAAVLERWKHLTQLQEPKQLERALDRAWGEDHARLLATEDAAASALVASDLAQRDGLLILGHGVQDRGRERPAGLALAASEGAKGDGLVFSEDLERLPAPALVALATCRSGRGPRREGDVVAAHLGGAFLRAGARAVVLAPTDLSYLPTQLAMETLFVELRNGTPAAEALRRARDRVAREERWQAPWYHGTLQLLGAGNLRLRR